MDKDIKKIKVHGTKIVRPYWFRKTLNKISLIVLRVSTFILFPLSIIGVILAYLLPQINQYFYPFVFIWIASLALITASYIVNEMTETR